VHRHGSVPHTPPDLALAVSKSATDLGLTVAVDRPFAGALVPAKHYRTDDRVKSIMIEVNRRIYMDELTGERLASFDNTREAVRNLLTAATTCLLKG
jgi:N-formylglutamate deformylase